MEINNIPHEVSYRNVKYPRVEFKTGKLLLVLPSGFDPEIVLKKHKKWILKKIEFIENCLKEAENKEIAERKEKEFREIIHSMAERISEEMGEKLNKIYFRTMKTKWASCSTKKNLTVNKLMKFLPEHLLYYIIFHEIAHLKQKRHNERFWGIIEKKFDNHEALERELFIYWFRVA